MSLSGLSWLDTGEQGTWTASVSGGSGSTTYDWEYQSVPSSNWTSAYCSGSSCSHTFYNYSSSQVEKGKIRVTATKGSEQDQASWTVNVNPAGGYYSSVTKRRDGVFQGLGASADENGAAEARWSTSGSLPAAEFVVEHRRDSTAAWSTIGTVPASDSTRSDSTADPAYQYTTDNLEIGTHQFRVGLPQDTGSNLRAVGNSEVGNVRRYTEPVTAEIAMDEAYRLSTYPNPV